MRFQCFHTPVSMQATLTASILIGVIIISPQTETAWLTGSHQWLVLLHNPKDAPSFFSGHWNTGTNPDLAFASASHNRWHLDRRTLEKFPRSQHRLITTPTSVTSVTSEPNKQWNFRRANWEKYSFITNQFAKVLLSCDTGYVDEAYQNFCNTNTILAAAKRFIPRGRRKNYRPC